ncbi:MAG: hypothetical protein WAL56_20080 [Candidatus Sulfotelmatobacter sp.]
MRKSARPNLSLDVELQIEQAKNQIHEHNWHRLQQMQGPTADALRDMRLRTRGLLPPMLKKPQQLRALIVQYAASLFESEASYYPFSRSLPGWLTRLGTQIGQSVSDKIDELETDGIHRNASLYFHELSIEAMYRAIREGIRDAKNSRIASAKQQMSQRKMSRKEEQEAYFATARALTGERPKELETEVTAKPTAPSTMQARKAFVDPILAEKGWSILDWAKDANVDHATAMDYWQGKTKPYASTRKKLARALGIKIEQLPE